MSAGVGVLVGLAVLAGSGATTGRASVLADRTGSGALGTRWRRARTLKGDDDERTLETSTTAVAALLRSGTAPAQAWWTALRVPADHRGVPDVAALVDAVAGTPPRRRRHDAALRRQAAGVVAACVVAAEVGASLAPVLDAVGSAVVVAEEERAARDAALAGPRATARLLGWLPIGGLVVGALLGVDLPGVVVGGGLGATSLVVGLALMVAGRAWTRRLVARAAGERDGRGR